uniref:Uncharacterized protein n=1 Tax=Amphimedon queenslandica TaxID=400682 RepID=A0A1X7VFJ3_AMPQE
MTLHGCCYPIMRDTSSQTVNSNLLYFLVFNDIPQCPVASTQSIFFLSFSFLHILQPA